MGPVTIEFFHDVICSFCFPMSYRMRQLQAAMPQVRILHRSYALVWDNGDPARAADDPVPSRAELLTHWARASRLDDLDRFNLSGMAGADFPFPSSVLPLLACQAGRRTAGEAGYWDMFDALQHALFVQCLNIGDTQVVERCARRTHLDFGQWQRHYRDPATRAQVEEDFRLVSRYGVRQVPTLVVDGVHLLEDGAIPLPRLMAQIAALASR